MRIPLSWLREYVPVQVPTDELAERLALSTLEVDRVLSPSGTVVWVNTAGDKTPIHLPADDVERALPGQWRGTASEAGWGTWAVLRRA